MKTKVFLASVTLLLSLAAASVVKPNTVSAHTGHRPAVCKGIGGGPNSAYTGEKEWDFYVNVDRNDARSSSLRYEWTVQLLSKPAGGTETTRSSGRRITFPQAATYKVYATLIDGDHRSSCGDMTVKIGQIAECTGIAGGPNSMRKGELEWDFALNTKENDSKRSELKYRYRVLDGSRAIHDSTSTSVNRRITFPSAGRYTIVGSVITGSKSDECRRTITIERASTTPVATGGSTSNRNVATSTNGTNTTTTPTNNTTTPTNNNTGTNSTNTNRTNTTTTSTTQGVLAATSTNTPRALPNTGPASTVAAFSLTSALGYAIDIIRRKFF